MASAMPCRWPGIADQKIPPRAINRALPVVSRNMFRGSSTASAQISPPILSLLAAESQSTWRGSSHSSRFSVMSTSLSSHDRQRANGCRADLREAISMQSPLDLNCLHIDIGAKSFLRRMCALSWPIHELARGPFSVTSNTYLGFVDRLTPNRSVEKSRQGSVMSVQTAVRDSLGPAFGKSWPVEMRMTK